MNAQRIPSIELSAADKTTKRNFEKLTARIGRVPNMPRAMAQSPAALEEISCIQIQRNVIQSIDLQGVVSLNENKKPRSLGAGDSRLWGSVR